MKPSQVAANLRAIAAYIEKTPKPSQTKVASAIKSMVSGLKVRVAGDPGSSPGTFEIILDLINEDKFESALKASFSDMDAFYHRNKHDPQFTIPNYTPFTLVDWDMEDGDSGYVVVSGEGLENIKVPFDGQDELGSWINDVLLQEFSKVHDGAA